MNSSQSYLYNEKTVWCPNIVLKMAILFLIYILRGYSPTKIAVNWWWKYVNFGKHSVVLIKLSGGVSVYFIYPI